MVDDDDIGFDKHLLNQSKDLQTRKAIFLMNHEKILNDEIYIKNNHSW